MKRSVPVTCPLCQDDVVNPVALRCSCKDTVYCMECVLKWRLPDSPPWTEDAFVTFGKTTFASPCPMCRGPLDLGMRGVAVEYTWTRYLALLSIMCTAVTGSDIHEVFDTLEVVVSDEELLELSKSTSTVNQLDAIAHFVLSKDRPIDVLKQVVHLDNIDAMARFLKYVGSYAWSASLTAWMHTVMAETSKWLSPGGVMWPSHCMFVTSFAKVMTENKCVENEQYLGALVESLRASRQTGSLTMHDTLLHTLKVYDRGAHDPLQIAGVDSISVVARYLDDDVLGHLAARLLKFKHIDASILPMVHAMSCRRKWLNDTVMLVNKIADLPANETRSMILEQLLKHIKRPVGHAKETLMAIQALASDANAGAICESLGDIMRLWMESPAVNMDETLDLVKAYMWKQRNYVSETELSD